MTLKIHLKTCNKRFYRTLLDTKLKGKPYPLPRIGDTLQQLEGFKYATSLDLNMGYYHIRLSPESSQMCTIVTEFGLYKYNRLPMGVSCSLSLLYHCAPC